MALEVHLGSKELEVLRSNLIEKPIFTLYTTVLSVCWPWCVARYFAIRHENSFVVIASDWSETESLLDYHTMEVATTEFPQGMSFKDVPSGIRRFSSPVSSFAISPPKSRCSRIEVLEYHDSGTSEAVHYDGALVFLLDDGRRFAIIANRSIEGGVAVTRDEGAIDALAEGHTLRKVIKNAEPIEPE